MNRGRKNIDLLKSMATCPGHLGVSFSDPPFKLRGKLPVTLMSALLCEPLLRGDVAGLVAGEVRRLAERTKGATEEPPNWTA
jgi:hypothetical protein